jgi:predicted alpha/beta-fold hydrolase
VFNHFGIHPDGLQNLILNFRGLKYSAQASSRDYFIERQAPPWPGFENTWVPIQSPHAAEFALSGRLGYARDARGNIKDATCLVILPGLFGDNGVQRSQDLAIPLREAGFHVLALELRGHGQTEKRYPRMYHAFGAFETDDLMQVSDWLERQPHVQRTGLIACCWNANIALLAAWYDGSRPDDPLISSTIRRNLVAYDASKRRFSAGIMAISPVVRGEVLMDELDRDRSRWKHPIYAAIQDTVRDRMKRKGYPITGSLRQLMDDEYGGYHVPMTHGLREGYSMLRVIDYKNQSAGDKLERARMPVVILHGADDPLVPAQDVADLMAGIENSKVAAIIFPSGGHVGFAGYAPKYYFSLILNFFDPVCGAAATGGQASPAEQAALIGSREPEPLPPRPAG